MKHLHSSNYYQPTLQTSNLIQLYPTPETPAYLPSYYATEIKQDFVGSQCKLRKEFCNLPNQWVSLNGFTSLDITDPCPSHVSTQTMPPSLCHFTGLILC